MSFIFLGRLRHTDLARTDNGASLDFCLRFQTRSLHEDIAQADVLVSSGRDNNCWHRPTGGSGMDVH